MSRSQQSFSKREKEKKKLEKRKAKQLKKEQRKADAKNGEYNEFAYVDKYGNITDTPPDPSVEKEEIDASSIVIGIPKKEHVEEDPIKQGRVEFFNDSKGYGFIKEKDTNESYFVHVNGLIDDIKENNMVTFELEKGPKGMMAVRVKRQ